MATKIASAGATGGQTVAAGAVGSVDKAAVTAKALALHSELKKAFAASDLLNTKLALDKLKLVLLELNFLPSDEGGTDTKEMLLARDVLEMGVQWSVRAGDIVAFERYMAQLKTYYGDYCTLLAPSSLQNQLLGLNLLRLLSQNRVAEFHQELETLDPKLLHGDVYIRQPVAMEQYLMEGSYNKIFVARANVPAESYLVFMDTLMETIREGIAASSERVYESLSVADATKLLNFASGAETIAFGSERGWTLVAGEGEGRFVFAGVGVQAEPMSRREQMENALHYAKELERIV